MDKKQHLTLKDFIDSMMNRAELERAWVEAVDEAQMKRQYEAYQAQEEQTTPDQSFLKLAVDRGALQTQVGGDHYKRFRIQPIEFCYANGIPFAEGNAIKYICRWRFKDGVKDLEKAKHILEMLIEMAKKDAPHI